MSEAGEWLYEEFCDYERAVTFCRAWRENQPDAVVRLVKIVETEVNV